MGRKVYFCPLCKNQLRSNKRTECRQCGDITAIDQPTVHVTLVRVEPWQKVPSGLRQLYQSSSDLTKIITVHSNGDTVTYEF